LKVSERKFVWKALVQLSVFRACLPKASEGMAFVASNPFFPATNAQGHKEAQSVANKYVSSFRSKVFSQPLYHHEKLIREQGTAAGCYSSQSST
jgi:hypothetical protein